MSLIRVVSPLKHVSPEMAWGPNRYTPLDKTLDLLKSVYTIAKLSVSSPLRF